ncbi:MAG TPA: energy transducer TonB [Candidatus Acidoferrum sp.]|nr:energy transducer TonB [Candidatus Acidoferrum sp.]
MAFFTGTAARIAICFSILFASSVCSIAQSPQSPLTLSNQQQSQLYLLASRILQNADKAGCKKGSCKILVNNFAGPSGATSRLGMQLADALSAQLAAQAQGIQIVDRSKLQEYLSRERIDSKLLEDDNAARWLASENGATEVLVGYLRGGGTERNLHVQLLDTRDFGKKEPKSHGRTEEVTFADLGTEGDLDPAESFGKLPELPGGEGTFQYGKDASGHKVTPPRCTYQPDPPYSEPARTVKFQGTLVLQVLVSENSQISAMQIVKGLPFGLNEQATESVRRWRCNPVTVDGQLRATKVPIEVSFRLY